MQIKISACNVCDEVPLV